MDENERMSKALEMDENERMSRALEIYVNLSMADYDDGDIFKITMSIINILALMEDCSVRELCIDYLQAAKDPNELEKLTFRRYLREKTGGVRIPAKQKH
jgi:hypothetical protein